MIFIDNVKNFFGRAKAIIDAEEIKMRSNKWLAVKTLASFLAGCICGGLLTTIIIESIKNLWR